MIKITADEIKLQDGKGKDKDHEWDLFFKEVDGEEVRVRLSNDMLVSLGRFISSVIEPKGAK